MKTILLLGSGEFGKEFAIAMSRLGHRVVAVDSYDGAPAQQVSAERAVIDMLDGEALDQLVERVKPDIIVPEIEAIRTERFFDYESRGIHVVPSARAANFTMNRRAIRDLAVDELGIRTAPFRYAKTRDEFQEAIKEIGIPCVVKPLMSSSGKGQSTIRSETDIERAWQDGIGKGRGDLNEVIVEGFVDFHTEITLLTVTQINGPTLFCAPIGHVQARGDYQESWQPCHISESDLASAQEMAERITRGLTGAGLWGVEFFLTSEGVIFSELSPRPHDTGMVTLAGTQNLNEFELHARAVLGIPIPQIELQRAGASAVILASYDSPFPPHWSGVELALAQGNVDIRNFGKPATRIHRRMGVVLVSGAIDTDMTELRNQAKRAANMITLSTA